jgi:hypothetical protein
MKYALLIYGDEAEYPAPESAEGAAEMEAYYAFTEAINSEGNNQGGEALRSVAAATTVRVRDGEVLATDGPFAETKEQLGGFYIVECDDLDQALAAAARIPGAKRGSVEVRPVIEF